MFCHFCGKNFEAREGFEEVLKNKKHLIRCEQCSSEQQDQEYDWNEEISGRGHGLQRRHH